MPEERTQVLVVGGGRGGVAAALGGAEAGSEVVVAEQGPWLGGQLPSQAVPLDEHPWVEQFGVTARYRRLRDGIRAYYREHYPLTPAAHAPRRLNPGAGLGSRPAAGSARARASSARSRTSRVSRSRCSRRCSHRIAPPGACACDTGTSP